jgi:LytS/YehU family sensor histidine kinase
MIMNLSTFFRTSLTADPAEDVTLAEEIRLQRLYLDIEAVRFPDRLIVDIDIPEALQSACVPCLILQPLIENAIKYGVSPSQRPVRLLVQARSEGEMMTLSVEDDGEGHRESEPGLPDGTGTGLRNVRDRLAARFGDRARLESGLLPGGGFGVTMSIPIVRNGC